MDWLGIGNTAGNILVGSTLTPESQAGMRAMSLQEQAAMALGQYEAMRPAPWPSDREALEMMQAMCNYRPPNLTPLPQRLVDLDRDLIAFKAARLTR